MEIHFIFILIGFTATAFGQSCDKPRGPFLKVRVKGRGKYAKFSCKRGLMLMGKNIAYCNTVTKQWSIPIPECVATGCPVPVIHARSNLKMTSLYGGSVLKFACKDVSLVLVGDYMIKCGSDKKWNSDKPRCLPPQDAFLCDFQQMCGWTQDKTDNFDWILGQENTPSETTGPLFDHTYGQGGIGKYLFTEGTLQGEGDVARVISPPYNHQPPESVCFNFWYHMHSEKQDDIGRLAVYLKEPGKINTWDEPMLSRLGNQGNNWVNATVHLYKPVLNFQIVVEAVTGKAGDIAIDDVTIINCPDKPETTVIVQELTTAPVIVQELTTALDESTILATTEITSDIALQTTQITDEDNAEWSTTAIVGDTVSHEQFMSSTKLSIRVNSTEIDTSGNDNSTGVLLAQQGPNSKAGAAVGILVPLCIVILSVAIVVFVIRRRNTRRIPRNYERQDDMSPIYASAFHIDDQR